MKQTRMKRAPEHYVSNKDFTNAVVEHAQGPAGVPISDYIAESFLRMAEGLSHKPNFYSYSYRQDMVMDGVENCIKAIRNFKVKAKTRGGKPNAFGYFTQIIWFAFLRRIAKEKRQQEIKERVITNSGIEEFMNADIGSAANNIVERIRTKHEKW
jgi:hypothetical protein